MQFEVESTLNHNDMIQDVTIEFKEPRKMSETRWYILVNKNDNRLRVIKDANVDMLFAGRNAGLLFSVYPTTEHLREPNMVELTVCTAYLKGETSMSNWDTLPQKIKESGVNTTIRILIPLDQTDDFFDAIPSGMARRGECRWAEFLLDDAVIANYLSSGKQWDFERWGLFNNH